MSGRDRLLEEVRQAQDRGTAEQVAEARARLFGAPVGRRQPWAIGMAAGLLAALLLLGVLWSKGAPPAAEVQLVGSAEGQPSAWISVPPESTQPFAFSDGTVVVAAPGARARVLATTPRGGRFGVERGKISVSVPPRRGAEWSFEVGPFTVLVTGTRFDVGWDAPAEVFELQMRDGSVKVSGPTIVGLTSVEAGQRLRIALAPAAPRSPVIAEAPAPRQEQARASASASPVRASASASPREAPSAPPPPKARAAADIPPREAPPAPQGSQAPAREATADPRDPALARAPEAPPPIPEPLRQRRLERSARWQELLAAGQYREGLALVPDFERECRDATAKDALLLADAARYVGRMSDSERAHRILRERFPGSAEAALAAFGLGRLRFEASDDEAAVRWLELYLAERPDGVLGPEALGRILEARIRSGALEEARRVARRYLARAPSGPQAAVARQLLEPER